MSGTLSRKRKNSTHHESTTIKGLHKNKPSLALGELGRLTVIG
ncbi:hypothetical protein [uncultured Dokdonia sp.]